MKKRKGFSLLELMMVVGIILIIASMAVPSLLRSHQTAQESSAIAQLRTINSAEVTYLASNQGSYGDIPALITQGLLDPRFLASISGYSFTLAASGANYTANANPTSINAGRFGYFSAADAIIRYATYQAANCTPCFPIGQSGAPIQ
jgi:prepilin-type N-terminal cleavage/methylation domain-containing protein